MNNLNSILVEGNLVRDAEYRTTAKGKPLCTFSIASNRYDKHDDELAKEVSYFDVQCWQKMAETCQQFGHKGRGVRVVGRLKQDRWNDAEGKAHAKITIVAGHIEFRPEAKSYDGGTGESNGSAENTKVDETIVEEETVAINW
jgi:single-strand DNA-binding protein